MNHLLPATLALWLMSPSVRAQPEPGVALKSGPNAATDTRDHRANRYGISGGLAGYLQQSLTSKLSIAGQMELLYTPRGAEVVREGRYLGMIRGHYLDIMLVARPEVYLGTASVYLLIGGGLNLLLGANLEDASGMRVDLTEFYRRRDIALLAGVGVKLHLPRRMLGPCRLDAVFLEARHDRGLVTFHGEAKNRTSSLMLGLSFALGSR